MIFRSMCPSYLVANLMAEMLSSTRFVWVSSANDKEEEPAIRFLIRKRKDMQAELIEGQI
jgi:hypothetical protein